MKKYRVTFLPAHKSIEVSEGSTIAQAAQRTEIHINSLTFFASPSPLSPPTGAGETGWLADSSQRGVSGMPAKFRIYFTCFK
jgi:hypothetical protein